MAKKDFKCGSFASYHKHKRRGEKPCEACRLAYNEYKRQKAAEKRHQANARKGLTVIASEIVTPSPGAEGADYSQADKYRVGEKEWCLEKYLADLAVIEQAIPKALPRELSSLVKNHGEIAQKVFELCKGDSTSSKETAIEQLAKRRAQRCSGS